MKQKVNAVILAGTKNCIPFDIEKKKEYKQYLQLNGKYNVEYCLDAVLHAKRVDKIFIVCDPKRMTHVLRRYDKKTCQRIHIIENKDSLMESILYCFKEWTEQAILVPSDAPFLEADDIDVFIKDVDETADYVMGFTDGTALDTVFEKRALFINKERIKYGLFPMYHALVRISNLHYLSFKKITDDEVALAQAVFDNRKLLDEHGRKNRRSWRNIAGACLKYLHKRHYNPAILLGSVLALVHALLFYAAHKTAQSKFGKFYSFFLRRDMIAKTLTLLTGCRIACQIIISKNLRPMLDIDVPETYLLFAKNRHFEELKAALK
jgi:2-C-methyl-D-erythritol 4-phosphate cytidylyltransferase